MRVLFINTVYGVGSTGKIVRDLEMELTKQGHTVRVCYGRKSSAKSKNAVQVSSKIETYIDALLTRLTGLHGCFSPISTQKIIKEIDRFNPDIVHLHNIHGYYVNIYRLITYLKKREIRVVWTLHDELMFTGKCSYAYGCDKWRVECGQCPQIQEYPKSLFFDFSKLQFRWKKKCLKNIKDFCFVTPSKWLKERVESSILNSASCAVINNGIDITETFVVREADRLRNALNIGDKKVVLTVTDDVFSDRKGIKEFCDLADMNSEQPLVFIVVGGVREDLQRDNILYIPKTASQKELGEYYSLADVFVIPSKCDNFPTVCIESLACGTPVIGFDAGGISETAPDETIGKFVKTDDMQALNSCLHHFLSNPANERKEFSRKYAEEHYDKKTMVDRYIELYSKLETHRKTDGR